MKDKHIAIIGAGPGGLTAAMILAHRGYKVSVFEREARVGGRNAPIQRGQYLFDTGPTFLMMKCILEQVFCEAGHVLSDYCELKALDPMYHLSFVDREVLPTTDHIAMRQRISRMFPGNEPGYDQFLSKEKVRYEKMYPCLKKPYNSVLSMFSSPLLKALPYLSLGKSLYQTLASYFQDEQLRISFTFQAKYLGMSPWECPAAFTIIPYIEHEFGIYHVVGGLSRISDAMAEVAKKEGAEVFCNTPVKHIITRGKTAVGLMLENNELIEADAVVINADFGYAMSTLFAPGTLKKYSLSNLRKKKYSCSTFMLYLGVDKLYDEPHHKIIFANDYKSNVEDIVKNQNLSEDMSVYIRNASVTDPTLAPKGHSALYVLVPVPNNESGIDWNEELTASYRNAVLNLIIRRTSMHDLREHIREEYLITPTEWEQQRGLFRGATFNLSHTLGQMLYFRPHNKFEEIDHCYLVGGGTHPGSGLPTIYESGRISANLISRQIW